MSPGASKQMKDLFATARADGPSADVEDALWQRIAGATVVGGLAVAAKASAEGAGALVETALPAKAAGAVATKTLLGGTAAKLVVAGALVGAVVTGGVVAALTSGPGGGEPPAAGRIGRTTNVRAPVAAETTPASGRVPLAEAAPRAKATAVVAPGAEGDPPRAAGSPDAVRREARLAPVAAAAPSTKESALAEEARLLTEARRALVRGDATTALALVAEVKRLPVRALQPEQMGIEARALRAAGRADEAAAVELGLRARFPEHALAR